MQKYTQLRTYLFILFVSLFSHSSFAQVTGSVYDDTSGDPLISATVQVKGTTIGAITDIDGNYRLGNVPSGPQVLLFSYISYATDSVAINYQPGTPVEVDARLNPAGFTGDVVVVTGQRQGQNAAINQQVKANTIVNVVSADRIRELPDENAAESVGRLPGVSVSRSGGEGQRVNIRGLSPKYSTVALDGVTIPATGQGRRVFTVTGAGGGAGQSNPQVDDRSVDLSMISSEALAGIEVYKSLTPDQDGDAIGGRVNFISARAPEVTKIYANLQGGYNTYHGTTDNFKSNVSYSSRFLNKKIGIIASGGYSTIDRSSDSYNVSYIFQGEPALNSLQLNDNTVQRQRLNGALNLDYDLGGGHSLFLSSLYGGTSVESENRNLDLRIRTTSASVGAGTSQSSINLYNASLTGIHPFGKMKLDWKATFVQTDDEGGPGYGYGFEEFNPYAGEAIPQVDPFLAVELYRADPNVLGGGGAGGGGITRRSDQNIISQLNLRRDVRVDGINLSGFLKTGAKMQYKDRTRNSTGDLLQLGGDAFLNLFRQLYPENPEPRFNTPGATPFLEPDVDLTGFFDGQFPIDLSVDPRQAEVIWNQLLPIRRPAPRQGLSDYEAVERIYAGYVMADVNIGKRFSAVGGFRYEQSVNDYGAYELNNFGQFLSGDEPRETGEANFLRSDQRYGELLPMVNLKYKVFTNDDNGNGFDVRFAATKALQRPDFYNVTPFININTSNSRIDRSDPNLLPTTAWNYDLFLTYYSGKFGLFTVGGFYKELDNVELLFGRREQPEYIQENFGERYELENAFIVTEPINSPFTTFVRGVELEVQTNLSWLPSPFDGIVIYGNISRINSDTRYPQRIVEFDFETFTNVTIDTSRVGTLPGQARDLANLSLGYDKGNFSGRLSYSFQGESISFIAGNEFLDGWTSDYARIDFSAKYKVSSNVSLQLNATNLLNRFDDTFVGSQRNVGSSNIFGPIYWFGVRYTASRAKD